MSKQLKPGILCMIRGALGTPELSKHVVTTVRPVSPGEIFTTSSGRCSMYGGDSPGWVIKGQGLLPVRNSDTGVLKYDTERAIPEYCLIPINDPDIDVTETTKKEIVCG